MKTKLLEISAIFGTILALLMGSYYLGKSHARTIEVPGKTVRVVKERVDTMRVYYPQLKFATISDSLYIPVTDTVTVNDTVFVKVPREEKVYEEKDRYYAVVSGYKPSLDFLEVYNKETTITINHDYSRWTLGAYAGYGATAYQQKVVLGPQLGVGVQYNLIRRKR